MLHGFLTVEHQDSVNQKASPRWSRFEIYPSILCHFHYHSEAMHQWCNRFSPFYNAYQRENQCAMHHIHTFIQCMKNKLKYWWEKRNDETSSKCKIKICFWIPFGILNFTHSIFCVLDFVCIPNVEYLFLGFGLFSPQFSELGFVSLFPLFFFRSFSPFRHWQHIHIYSNSESNTRTTWKKMKKIGLKYSY